MRPGDFIEAVAIRAARGMGRHEKHNAACIGNFCHPLQAFVDIGFPVCARLKAIHIEPYFVAAAFEVYLQALRKDGMFVMAVADEDPSRNGFLLGLERVSAVLADMPLTFPAENDV
jgi:hypothetical protein